jgi:hypothetical protein
MVSQTADAPAGRHSPTGVGSQGHGHRITRGTLQTGYAYVHEGR